MCTVSPLVFEVGLIMQPLVTAIIYCTIFFLLNFLLFGFQFVGDSTLDRVFALLSRDNYSWDELQQRPLPDGVDPSRLEKYLNDDDFVVSNLAENLKYFFGKYFLKKFKFFLQNYLGLSREDFNAAPRWKQLEIRKEKGLF